MKRPKWIYMAFRTELHCLDCGSMVAKMTPAVKLEPWEEKLMADYKCACETGLVAETGTVRR